MYQDAIELLLTLQNSFPSLPVAILTFGDPLFQVLKLQASPKVSHLPAYIIQEPKAKYITNHFGNKVGILVDDKPNQNLPKPWVEVFLDRTQILSDATQVSPLTWQLSTLNQLPKLLLQEYPKFTNVNKLSTTLFYQHK